MIIKNDYLINHVFEYDVVLFGMGINNSMSSGLLREIAVNFPAVKESENKTNYGDIRKYGTIHDTTSDGIVFCACYVYNIGKKRVKESEYIDYDALRDSLKRCKRRYKGKKILSPIIGQDEYDGNGDKEKILTIYNEVFGDNANITIFDFKQCDFDSEIYKEMVSIRKDLRDDIITREEFNARRREVEWKRLNGIYKPMDEDFKYSEKKKKLKK